MIRNNDRGIISDGCFYMNTKRSTCHFHLKTYFYLNRNGISLLFLYFEILSNKIRIFQNL